MLFAQSIKAGNSSGHIICFVLFTRVRLVAVVVLLVLVVVVVAFLQFVHKIQCQWGRWYGRWYDNGSSKGNVTAMRQPTTATATSIDRLCLSATNRIIPRIKYIMFYSPPSVIGPVPAKSVRGFLHKFAPHYFRFIFHRSFLFLLSIQRNEIVFPTNGAMQLEN